MADRRSSAANVGPRLHLPEWLPAVILTIACLTSVHLLMPHRGLYLDDYALRTRVVDAATGEYTPLLGRYNDMYPARLLMHHLAYVYLALVPDHELLVRAAIALNVALNAVLLGGLVYRILRSTPCAMLAICGFLVPLYASEVVLWTTAAAEYLPAGAATLMFLHAAAGAASDETAGWSRASVAAFWALLMLMFAEAYITLLALAPLVTLAAGYRHGIPPRKAAWRGLRMLRVCMPLAVVVCVIYAHSLGDLRGGLDLSPYGLTTRAGAYVDRLNWLTFSETWGEAIIAETFSGGVDYLVHAAVGRALFFVILVSAVWTIVSARATGDEVAVPPQCGWIVLTIGVMWTLLTLFLPGLVARAQSLELRLLYAPTAGVTLTLAAACWMLQTRMSAQWLAARLIVGAGTVILVGSTIVLTGHARLYEQRSERDAQQITAVIQAVPGAYLPAGTIVVPYEFEPRGAQPTSGRLLAGVFESWWSASEALNAAYRRTDLLSVTANRWVEWDFEYDASHSPAEVLVQDTPVRSADLLLLVYRDSRAFAVRTLIVPRCTGTPAEVTLPIGRRLADSGVPVLDRLVVPGPIKCQSGS
jgi:hypothetical protein